MRKRLVEPDRQALDQHRQPQLQAWLDEVVVVCVWGCGVWRG